MARYFYLSQNLKKRYINKTNLLQMSIKLSEGINNISVRLNKKSETNSYIFKLKNKNTKTEVDYNSVDLNILSLNCLFIINIESLEYGEYIYSIIDTNNNLLRSGVAYYTYPDSTIPTYSENNKYITYGE